jgi:antitoxin MazE
MAKFMQVKIKKWGNSPSVRIPSSVMKATGLKVDATVDVREENGLIIIQPIRENTLADLLAAITPDNLHGEMDSGGPVGNEAL